MKKQIYGILGGYGTVATTRFHQLLNQKWIDYNNAYDDHHFPHTITTNLPIQIMDVAGTTLDVEKLNETLKDNASYLVKSDEVYALCNTFHLYKDVLLSYLPQLVSIPELTSSKIPDGERAVIAASELTLKNGLYARDRYFTINYPSDLFIAEGMRNVVNEEELKRLVDFAVENEATSIVLGCTDLSISVDKLRELTTLPVYDSLEILVDHIFLKETLV